MGLPRYNRFIQDGAGNIVPGASVKVRLEVPGKPLVQLYSDPAGDDAIGNPILSNANGYVGFHVQVAGEYEIEITSGGETATIPFEQIGPASVQNALGPETQITSGSYTVGTTETFLTIKRAGPTLTEITLPAVADRNAMPFAYVDWSTSIVSDHEIKFIANGSETVMKAATYSVWSNSSGLARGWVYPAEDLSGWVVT